MSDDRAVFLVLVVLASGLFWLGCALYVRRLLGAVAAVALVAAWWVFFGWLAWEVL